MNRIRPWFLLGLILFLLVGVATIGTADRESRSAITTIGSERTNETVEFVSEPIGPADESYVVATRSQGGSDADSLEVWKLNATGKVIWERSIDTAPNFTSLRSVLVQSDGIVVQTSLGAGDDRLIRVTSDGDIGATARLENHELWADGTLVDRPGSGFYYIRSTSVHSLSGSFDTQWVRNDTSAERWDTLPDGSIVTVDWKGNEYITHTVLSRISPDGRVIWKKNFSTAVVSDVVGLDERILLTTESLSSNRASLMILDENGDTLDEEVDEVPYVVASAEEGAVVYSSCPDHSCRGHVLRFGQSGEREWEVTTSSRLSDPTVSSAPNQTIVRTANHTVMMIQDGTLVYNRTFNPSEGTFEPGDDIYVEPLGERGMLVQNGSQLVSVGPSGTERWSGNVADESYLNLVDARYMRDGTSSAVFSQILDPLLIERRNADGEIIERSRFQVTYADSISTANGTIYVGTTETVTTGTDTAAVIYREVPSSDSSGSGPTLPAFEAVVGPPRVDIGLLVRISGGVTGLAIAVVLLRGVTSFDFAAWYGSDEGTDDIDGSETVSVDPSPVSEKTDSLQCPNCGTNFDQSDVSPGDVCDECGNGFVTRGGERVTLEDDRA